MQILARHPFDRDDVTASKRAKGNETTVNGLILRFALSVPTNEGYRARAAIAVPAALFGTDPAGAAQVLEQSHTRRGVFYGFPDTVEVEMERFGHGAILARCPF